MHFAVLPKYHIGKIPPITVHWQYFLKSRYASFLQGVFETQVATSSLIN